jgi:hypothetical protein
LIIYYLLNLMNLLRLKYSYIKPIDFIRYHCAADLIAPEKAYRELLDQPRYYCIYREMKVLINNIDKFKSSVSVFDIGILSNIIN